MFDSSLASLAIYIPLSIIGLWRWSFWLIRRMAAATYRPALTPISAHEARPSVTVITPVYNEDPAVFDEALGSWEKNGVDEVVAVIDHTNVQQILDYQRRYVDNKTSKTRFRMIVTPKPGKRAALCDGIERATGDLIALVDSDTIWDDNVMAKTLPHFRDPGIGGATISQRIKNRDTVGNVLFDILLWSRYRDEVPFLLGTGSVVNTLSGRTAFYRREALLDEAFDNIHDLRHEFFLGTRAISGDDKRLTHLVARQGWDMAYVRGATVFTPGMGSLRNFFKQRLRWTRNSWRADLRAVAQGWVWRHPALALFMIDRFVQPLFMLIGPVVFTIAVVNAEWVFAGILLSWWMVSRFIRIFGYFRLHPRDVVYLPAYIIYGYINAVLRIYALATLIENSWATRWNKQRVARRSIVRRGATLAGGYAAIGAAAVVLTVLALSFRNQIGVDVQAQPTYDAAELKTVVTSNKGDQAAPNVPLTKVEPTSVSVYTVQPGDSMNGLAFEFGMTVPQLKELNGIADGDVISVGQEIVHFEGSGGGDAE